MSLEDVIARLEGASEGHRDLDYAIHNAVYGERMIGAGIRAVPGGGWWHPEHGKIAPPEHYTTSLDAAMTLLPEGAVFKVMTDYGELCRASVSRDDPPLYTGDIDAATPALALCIACLRAKAAAA